MGFPMPLGGVTVTVVRATLVDSTRDNSEVRDWTHATETPIDGCQVEPFLLSNKLVVEDNKFREFSSAHYRVWMPAGTDVEYTDRLLIHGESHDVYGQPGRWYDFEGVESHVTVLAKIRRG